jgi:hypothetical protein
MNRHTNEMNKYIADSKAEGFAFTNINRAVPTKHYLIKLKV